MIFFRSRELHASWRHLQTYWRMTMAVATKMNIGAASRSAGLISKFSGFWSGLCRDDISKDCFDLGWCKILIQNCVARWEMFWFSNWPRLGKINVFQICSMRQHNILYSLGKRCWSPVDPIPNTIPTTKSSTYSGWTNSSNHVATKSEN